MFTRNPDKCCTRIILTGQVWCCVRGASPLSFFSFFPSLFIFFLLYLFLSTFWLARPVNLLNSFTSSLTAPTGPFPKSGGFIGFSSYSRQLHCFLKSVLRLEIFIWAFHWLTWWQSAFWLAFPLKLRYSLACFLFFFCFLHFFFLVPSYLRFFHGHFASFCSFQLFLINSYSTIISLVIPLYVLLVLPFLSSNSNRGHHHPQNLFRDQLFIPLI